MAHVVEPERGLVEPCYRSDNIDLDHLPVLVEAVLPVTDLWHHASSVDEQIEPAEVAGDLLENCRYVGVDMHIVDIGQHLARERRGKLVQPLLASRHCGHSCSLSSQLAHQFGPDARGGADYDCVAIFRSRSLSVDVVLFR